MRRRLFMAALVLATLLFAGLGACISLVRSITPIIIGDGRATMQFSRALFENGVLGTGIAFPTVPEGKARVRTIVSAAHTKDELSKALGVLKKVGKDMGIIQ